MTDQIKLQARSIPSHDAHSIIRVLRWYEKSGDRLVGETVLKTLGLPELQQLFEETSDNLMVDSYRVCTPQVDRLQNEMASPIDLNTYDYYVECDAV